MVQKVLHIAKMTGVAGTEKHLLTLLPGLKGRGLDVRLIILADAAFPMDAYAAQMSGLGVPAEQMPIGGHVDAGLFGRLRRRIGEMAPDAVHTHLIHADLHGVIAARRAGVARIFTTLHNDDPFRGRWAIRMLQGYLWKRITRAIAISEAIRRHAIEVQGAPPEKVVLIYHGIELAAAALVPGRPTMRFSLGLPADAVVFGSVCRLTEQKGIAEGLQAFAEVVRRVPGARYVIAGDGPLRAALEARAKAAGLGDSVRFLGWRDDAAEVMTAFDVFLMPSRWEGFGLAAIEAMAAGLPVIATRVTALPEIVADGVTGRLVGAGDVATLVRAMLEACENPGLARQMGMRGRERVATEFGAGRMIDRTLAVYQES